MSMKVCGVKRSSASTVRTTEPRACPSSVRQGYLRRAAQHSAARVAGGRDAERFGAMRSDAARCGKERTKRSEAKRCGVMRSDAERCSLLAVGCGLRAERWARSAEC